LNGEGEKEVQPPSSVGLTHLCCQEQLFPTYKSFRIKREKRVKGEGLTSKSKGKLRQTIPNIIRHPGKKKKSTDKKQRQKAEAMTSSVEVKDPDHNYPECPMFRLNDTQPGGLKDNDERRFSSSYKARGGQEGNCGQVPEQP